MQATRREFVRAGTAMLGGALAAGSAAIANADEAASISGESGGEIDGDGHYVQTLKTQFPLMDSTMYWHSIMITYVDLDRALELWRDVMGFTVVSDGVTSGEYFDPAVWADIFDKDEPPSVRVACLQHDTGAMLELHQPVDPPLVEEPAENFSYWHSGTMELTLRVRDIDGWLQKIKAAGYQTLTDYVWDCGTIGRSFEFYDTEGHIIQLWECEKSPRWF